MKIQGTKETPTLEFDSAKNKLKIYGVSIAINPTDFWGTVMNLMKGHLEEPNDLELDLALDHFNTPSATRILALLALIDGKMGEHKKRLTVVWHYDDDEDMKETGEDLASMVSDNTTWVFEK